jgi:hypothetical protein
VAAWQQQLFIDQLCLLAESELDQPSTQDQDVDQLIDEKRLSEYITDVIAESNQVLVFVLVSKRSAPA